MKQSLDGVWRLYNEKYDIESHVPGSLCCSLLDYSIIDDPYYRDNEYKTLPIFYDDCIFERTFVPENTLLMADKILLRFYGIDTMSKVYLNGELILTTDNMFREYTCDITELMHKESNMLSVRIASPCNHIAKKKL